VTFLEAAEKALQINAKPMHSREIVLYAKKRGWIDCKGKTPNHSVQAAIWKNIKKLGSRSRFVMTGRVKQQRKYSLRAGN
jgi:hypothetical protein